MTEILLGLVIGPSVYLGLLSLFCWIGGDHPLAWWYEVVLGKDPPP